MYQRNSKQHQKCTHKQQSIRFDNNDDRKEMEYQKQYQQCMEQLYDFHQDENRVIHFI